MAHVKLKRIETSICSIINIKLSTPIFGLPMVDIFEINFVTIFVDELVNSPNSRCLYSE